MRVLVIGGTGLVGPHVVRELLSVSTIEVSTFTRTGKARLCEISFKGDRDDLSALRDVLSQVRPDVVIDMIPFTAKSAETLVSALNAAGLKCRMVAISSIDVYRAYGRMHRTETAPYQTCPISENMALRQELGLEGLRYDKLNVERILFDAFDDICVLRLPATYGWPDTTRVARYLDQMMDGAEVITLPADVAEFRFSRCFHKNAAFAIKLAVLSQPRGAHVYNVAEPKAFSELEWAEKIAACCGWRGVIDLTDWTPVAERPTQHLDVSTEAIRRELGFFEKYDVEEGLSDTVAFHAYQRLSKPYEKFY